MTPSKKIELVRLSENVPETLNAEVSVGVVDKAAPEAILGLILDLGIKSIVQTTAPFVPEELKTAQVIVADNRKFLDFPMATIMMPDIVNEDMEKKMCELRIPFSSSSQKGEILEKVHAYVSTQSKLNSLIDDVLLAVDELFTNSIYNAPFMNTENSNVGASRKQPNLVMADNKQGEIMVGSFAGRLVIGCRDPFGTLNVFKFLSRFRDCYEKGMREMMTFGEGGAGVGGYLVFNMSMSYYLGVEMGVQTIICCSFPLGKSASYREEIPKNVHCFFLNPNAKSESDEPLAHAK